MSFPSVFKAPVTAELLARVGRLQADSQPRWGKMNAAQMLAHCCIVYEEIHGLRKGHAPWVARFLGRYLFKRIAVGENPFHKNIPTPKTFVVADARVFDLERERLIKLITETHGLGESSFEGREHVSFGPLRATEWSNLLYKHLDHHLMQFGV
jgi:Protein of unknown function (DUF1569)